MPKNNDSLARSETDGRDGQKRSHGTRTGRTPNESAGRRPRDLESGVDHKSAHARTTSKLTSGRAPGLDQATMASDRPKGREALDTVQVRTKKPPPRVEGSDSSDDSSDTGTDSSYTDSSSMFSLFPPPSPYDGRADRHVFDLWELQVKLWAERNKLSDKEVMYLFLPLVSGKTKTCFMWNFATPSRYRPPRKQTLKEILEVIHEECFPPRYKTTLHKELMSATQGNLGVREFADELRSLAKRLPYVGDQCLAAIFFVGVHKYIRVRFILDGMKQDSTDLETLVDYASRYEDARRMLVSESAGQTLLCAHDPSFAYDFSLQRMEMRRPTSHRNSARA